MNKRGKHHNAQVQSLLVELFERGPALGTRVELQVPIKRLLIGVAVQYLIKGPRRGSAEQFGL